MAKANRNDPVSTPRRAMLLQLLTAGVRLREMMALRNSDFDVPPSAILRHVPRSTCTVAVRSPWSGRTIVMLTGEAAKAATRQAHDQSKPWPPFTRKEVDAALAYLVAVSGHRVGLRKLRHCAARRLLEEASA